MHGGKDAVQLVKESWSLRDREWVRDDRQLLSAIMFKVVPVPPFYVECSLSYSLVRLPII